MGCPVIDADVEAHLSYRRRTHAHDRLVSVFGQRILDAEGRIDRVILGPIVFSDPHARAVLNDIVHPATRHRVESRLATLQSQGHPWAVLEATLFVEAGWLDLVDRLWLVVAPVDSVLTRLRRDRGQDEDRVRRRIAAQMPPPKMMELADDIIYNDADLAALRARVFSLWRELNESPASRIL